VGNHAAEWAIDAPMDEQAKPAVAELLHLGGIILIPEGSGA